MLGGITTRIYRIARPGTFMDVLEIGVDCFLEFSTVKIARRWLKKLF